MKKEDNLYYAPLSTEKRRKRRKEEDALGYAICAVALLIFFGLIILLS